MTHGMVVWGIEGLPEITEGTDVAGALAAAEPELRDGDIVVVTSKVLSKAEGQLRAGDRETAIDAETRRVVARRGATRIVETHHGFVLAAAGVDASNTAPGTVVLLPEDPDASARRIRAGLRERLGVTVAVVVSDTFGRPWRNGLTDVAVGLAGMDALDDLRGRSDTHGNPLDATVTSTADELAGAAELVKGKLAGVPAAAIRGLAHRVRPDDGAGVRPMLRPADEDMFRYGSREVVTARETVRDFRSTPLNQEVLRRAVAAALTAPHPHRERPPWRFVVVESTDVRKRLLDATVTAWMADWRAEGLDEHSIAARTQDAEALRTAPSLVVPCLADVQTYADVRPEREALVAATGAAVENLLVALTAEGAGSFWAPGTASHAQVVHAELNLPAGWEPAGMVGAGYPLTPGVEQPPPDPDDFLALR